MTDKLSIPDEQYIVRGHILRFSIHRKGAKDAKKTTLLWRLISLNIFFAIFAIFAIFAPLR